MAPKTPRDINLEYYEAAQAGRQDYWRLMAAPRHRARTLLRLVEEIAPRALIDLGCGSGQLLSEVAARFPGISLSGIDLSQTQIAANRSRMPAIRWEAADLENADAIPAKLAGAFDVLIASEIIEHLRAPSQFLRAIGRLARPGSGRLLMTTQSGTLHETERRVGHVRHFTAQELGGLLEENGWRAERIWNAGYPFHDLSKWWANRNPDQTMDRFSARPYGPMERAICAALRAAFLLNSSSKGAQLFAVARSQG